MSESKTSTIKKSQVFRTECRTWGEERSQHSWDALSDVQRSHFMLLFYISRVYGRLNPGAVPESIDDIEQCIVDGAYDDGADFAYRNNGKVLIVQAKYHAGRKNQKADEVEHFRTILPRLHPHSNSKAKQNEKLLDVVGDIDWTEDIFELIFITLAKVTQEVQKSVELGVVGSKDIQNLSDIEDRADLFVQDESALNDSYRNAETFDSAVTEPIVISFNKKRSKSPWLKYESDSNRISYIGIINAGQLAAQVSKYRFRLFNLNIRNYVGDTRTNKDIITTATDHPDDFYFFNNGITAVATKIEENEENRTLTMSDFSIINGAQTVRSIHKAHSKSENATHANVLIRITEVSYKQGKNEEEFLENVTRYNNTQNAIKISDFRSNDKIQRSLEQHFNKLSRSGKKYRYKNKRSGDRKANSIAISMEIFAKTVHSFLYGPVDYFGGTSYLFDISSKGGYCKIFGNGEYVDDELSQIEFDTLAGTYFICEQIGTSFKRIKSELLTDEDDEKERIIIKNSLMQKWMVYFMVAELIRYKCNQSDTAKTLEEVVGAYSNPKWLDNSTQKIDLITDYTEVAVELLQEEYRTWSNSTKYDVRAWFQKSEALNALSISVRKKRLSLKKLPVPWSEQQDVLDT